MIWDNPLLDRMIERETFAEIVARLTPAEIAVALLRADGLDDQEIADALGVTRSAVQARIKTAVARISASMPAARSMLTGRDRYNTANRQFTIPEEVDALSIRQVAQVAACSTQAVRNWIAAGRFPHAEQAPGGIWLIPWSDLERLP